MCARTQILAGEVEHYSGRLEEEQAALHGLLEERMASASAQVRRPPALCLSASFHTRAHTQTTAQT